MAIFFTGAVVTQSLRTEAPFVIVLRAINRAFTKLHGKTHRYLFCLCAIHIVNFHFQGLVRREVFRVRIKNSGHANFLARIHIVVIQYKRSLLERGVGVGIAFRHRIRGLVIRLCIFTIIDRRNLDVCCIMRRNRFADSIFSTINFDDLRIFIRRSTIEIGNRSFFPGVTHDAKTYDLHFRFGNARTQPAKPQTRILRFRKNFLVTVPRRRNNCIVLVQRNTPPAPAILQLIHIQR